MTTVERPLWMSTRWPAFVRGDRAMITTIRPAGPKTPRYHRTAADARRIEQAASSDRPRHGGALRQPGQGRHVLLAVSPDHTVLGPLLTVESNPGGGTPAAWASWCSAPTARDRRIGTALLEAVLDLADNGG